MTGKWAAPRGMTEQWTPPHASRFNRADDTRRDALQAARPRRDDVSPDLRDAHLRKVRLRATGIRAPSRISPVYTSRLRGHNCGRPADSSHPRHAGDAAPTRGSPALTGFPCGSIVPRARARRPRPRPDRVAFTLVRARCPRPAAKSSPSSPPSSRSRSHGGRSARATRSTAPAPITRRVAVAARGPPPRSPPARSTAAAPRG